MLFSRAIRKYGKECFVIEILEDSIKSVDDANDAEKKWIANLSSNNKKIGYNISDGGYNYTRTKKQIEKIKRVRAKQPHPMLGKKHSKESKEKISQSLIGHNVSSKTRKKISKAQVGRKLKNESIVKRTINAFKNNKNKKTAILNFDKKD